MRFAYPPYAWLFVRTGRDALRVAVVLSLFRHEGAGRVKGAVG